MKKILIASFIALFSTATFAQSSFRIGLKAAPSLAWLKPDTKALTSGGSALKFGYGLMTEFNLSDNYAFSTGLDVEYSGGTINFNQDDSIYYAPVDDTSNFFMKSRDYTMQYVTIPLTLKMKTNPVGAMTYYGQFGFNPSFNIKSRSVDNGQLENNASTSIREDEDIYSDANKIRLALNLGAGIEYNIAGNTNLIVGINYNNGFTNILRGTSKLLKTRDVSNSEDQAFEQKVTSNFVALTAGIFF